MAKTTSLPAATATQAAPDQERRYVKALLVETKAADSGEKTFRFRATNATLDRQNETITPTGWETEAFMRNPVFLLAHKYDTLPIGKTTALTQDEDGLLADVVFDQEDPIARQVQSKYERGFLNAVSVGFQPIEIDRPKDGPLTHTKKALLEISAVSVPANPDALMLRSLLGGLGADVDGDDAETRATWSTAFVNALPDASFAVILPGGEKDGEGKTTPRDLRKLPHHGTDGAVDVPHLRNAMSREPQTDMPAEFHAKAHAHLMRHAEAMGMDVSRSFGGIDPDQLTSQVIASLRDAVTGAVREALTGITDQATTAAAALAAARRAAAQDSTTREALWESAAAEMVALLTPGSPDSDEWRKRAYTTVERTYHLLDKTPPEFKTNAELEALGATEWRGLFWAGELDRHEKAGRVLSRANEQRIRQMAALCQEVLSTLGDPVQDSADEPPVTRTATAPDAQAPDADVLPQAMLDRLAETFAALGVDLSALKAADAPDAAAVPVPTADTTTVETLSVSLDGLDGFQSWLTTEP